MNESTHAPFVAVVSHSHWDREWYLPFEPFRYRLVQLVEDLLGLLDSDPGYEHFMLDGQTVLLEDIAEVRPDLMEQLQHHIAKGRISIGPWYVLQDEFLVSGESIARNLLLGQKVARQFGNPMNVGYVPDAFGHVSQIPRILKGFDIDTAVLWRGVGDQAQHNEWLWKAPGGASVLCLWLRWNYSTAERLPDDVDAVHAKLRGDLDRTAQASRANLLLWMNGTDHQMPQPTLSKLLTHLRSQEPDADIRHCGLEEAARLAHERLDGETLDVIQNELRRTGPGVGFLLPGVLSARSWDQRDHDRAEWRLSREAEPFCTLAGLDRRGSLEYAWKTLLKCQPHDSICGCSVDAVHREVSTRQARVYQLATALLEDAVKSLAEDPIHHPGGITKDRTPGALAIANTQPRETTALVDVRFSARREIQPFRLVGPQGEVPYAIASDVPTDPTLPSDHEKAGWMRTLHLRILPGDLPPLGVQTLRIEPGTPSESPSGLHCNGDRIDNGRIALEPIPGGIAITDLSSGHTIRHTFEISSDRGDEYNYCPLEGETSRTSEEMPMRTETEIDATSAALKVSGLWSTARELSDDRTKRVGNGSVELRLTARLAPRTRTVALTIELDNQARDHRLRVRLQTGEKPASFLTDSAFDWIRRLAGEPPPAPGSLELPVAQHPMRSMAAIDLDSVRVGVAAVGLREVELDDEGTFFLTILRAVGWLSRGDLANRPHEAGPSLATPEAQGLGEHRFCYALAFDSLEERPSAIHSALEPLVHPPKVVPISRAGVDRPGGLSIEPASVRLAAVKRAEEDDRILVRLIGPDDGEPAQVTLTVDGEEWRAALSDLDERPGEPLAVDAGDGRCRIAFELPAREVTTVALSSYSTG